MVCGAGLQLSLAEMQQVSLYGCSRGGSIAGCALRLLTSSHYPEVFVFAQDSQSGAYKRLSQLSYLWPDHF